MPTAARREEKHWNRLSWRVIRGGTIPRPVYPLDDPRPGDSVRCDIISELRPLFDLGFGFADIGVWSRQAPYYFVAVPTNDGVIVGRVQERTECRPSWWSVTQFEFGGDHWGSSGNGATIHEAARMCACMYNQGRAVNRCDPKTCRCPAREVR